MAEPGVLTFLIADVRGYSRFTEEYGDEAAARLAARFVEVMREGIEAHGGSFGAVRGDEGLAVFTSARQAIRAAVDLQERFAAATEADDDLPLHVGIGIDAGEAVRLDDGSYRGAALNVAARLCARAHGGEVIVTEGTARLAGKVAGVEYGDHARVRLKNIPDPMHVVNVYSELSAPRRRSVRAVVASSRPLGWRLVLLVVLIATLTAGTVAYLTTGGPPAGAAGPLGASDSALEAIVPAELWRDCRLQDSPDRGATETAVCDPADGVPDSWRISAYRNTVALATAYEEIVQAEEIERSSGRCNAFSWGGELEWHHGAGRPGGRAVCYFDEDDAVIVWTHDRLGQATHRDVLMVARASGGDHVGLTRWWRPWHHVIGTAK
jgi:class 3 adenylate cyclase